VLTYSAICDVPEETLLLYVTALLRGHRSEIGTRKGRRAARCRGPAQGRSAWIGQVAERGR
jgi:hypothetical protein